MIFFQLCSTEQVAPPSGQSIEYMLRGDTAAENAVVWCVSKKYSTMCFFLIPTDLYVYYE